MHNLIHHTCTGFTIFNKWMLNEFGGGGFPFPVTITTSHMFMKFFLSRVIFHKFITPEQKASIALTQLTSTNGNCNLNNNNNNSNSNNNSSGNGNNNSNNSSASSVSDGRTRATTPLRLFINVVLIGVCTAMDIALSNESILYINITLYTTLKATVVIFTFFWSILFRIEIFRFYVFLAILGIFWGVGFAVFSTTGFSVFGVFLCLSASCISGLRWVLLQYMLLSDPLSASSAYIALYRFSPYAFMSILPVAILTEGYALVNSKFFHNFTLFFDLVSLLISSGILALFLIIAEVQLVQLTSSLTLSVAGE